jgi:hypothetical protein
MRPFLAAGALLALALLAAASGLPAATAATPGNAVFVYKNGDASTGRFGFSGPCNGDVTLTLTLDGLLGDGSTIVRTAKSTMVPDLCSIGCLDCPVPFTWVLKGNDVDLAGGGVVPAFSLQGVYAGGVLDVHGPV